MRCCDRSHHWVDPAAVPPQSQRLPLGSGELSRAKAELRSGAAFLDWLSERGRDLGACSQTDVDAWLAGERPDRHIARQFARWAMAQKLMPRLEFPAGHRGGPTPPIVDRGRLELTSRLLDDQTTSARDRLAGILVAVYAQPISRVARLSLEDITLSDSDTTIRLCDTPVALPGPIADAAREWLDQRNSAMPPMAAPSSWLFPGNPPSRPIGELTLSRRLKRIGITATRTAARRCCTSLAKFRPRSSLTSSVSTSPRPPHGPRSPAGHGADYPPIAGPNERLDNDGIGVLR